MTTSNSRTSEHPVSTLFLDRWSPRAFTGESMSEEALLSLFEAARWAPSASNLQPWRFVYAHRETGHWETLLGILNEGNQRWAKNAAVLAIIISKTHNRSEATGELRASYTHAFDAGAAWYALALQATLCGLHAHAMGGIDRDKAMQVLEIPDGFRVEAAVAIGKIADREILPEDLRARENPSQRKPVAEFAFEGRFVGG
ncbi:MAG: nitroreductase family protein [Shinella sp.]|nr:nitroreductase family protein [Shinella sp.]